jgi:hypothetical protein
MWEASRMLSSGIAQRREVDTDFDDENEVGHCAVCDCRILAQDD